MRGWRKAFGRTDRPAPSADPVGLGPVAAGSVSFDPVDAAFVADPYPLFEHLREHDPVHRSPGGAWVLTRHDDVRGALDDERLGNAPARYAVVHARNRERYVCADVAANILPFLDPPAHAAPRRALARAFHERLRRDPPDLAAIAEGILGEWRGRATGDLVADFASPFAVRVIAALLGVPRDDLGRLERWSESFFYLFAAIPSVAVREELDEALTEFRRYLGALVNERRSQPADDVISDLVHAHDAGLSEAALVDNCMLLFADGVENVDRAIGNAMYTLLRHPDQLLRLRERPELIPSAVEECLRYESPAQYIGRVALGDVEIRGITIPRGSMVLLVLGSANRDAGAFDAPDRFDITRSPNPHLAFGRGSHSCIGGTLVALEMEAALRCLLKRAHGLSLASDSVRFVPRPGHRWIESLPVRWKPEALDEPPPARADGGGTEVLGP